MLRKSAFEYWPLLVAAVLGMPRKGPDRLGETVQLNVRVDYGPMLCRLHPGALSKLRGVKVLRPSNPPTKRQLVSRYLREMLAMNGPSILSCLSTMVRSPHQIAGIDAENFEIAIPQREREGSQTRRAEYSAELRGE